MQEHHIMRGLANLADLTEAERLLADREQIELLQEQVDSLMLELVEKNEELRELEEELEYTHEELCQALRLVESIPIAEAKKCAQTLLEKQLPLREALAVLLRAIYGFPARSLQFQLAEAPAAIAFAPQENSECDRLSSNKDKVEAEINHLLLLYGELNELVGRLQTHSSHLKGSIARRAVVKE